jgi:hypothetical protein
MKKILAIGLLIITVCVTTVISSDVTVSWKHGGTTNTVVGYNIYYGNSTRNYTNFITTGYVTNVVISNLPPNTTFYFAGTTIGVSNSETQIGNELQFVTTSDTISNTNKLPSEVKNFTLTKVVQTTY